MGVPLNSPLLLFIIRIDDFDMCDFGSSYLQYVSCDNVTLLPTPSAGGLRRYVIATNNM